MARPTKFNQDIAKGVANLLRQGYNLRAAAQVFGVSEASLSRWRERYPEFNKAVAKATREQNERACHLSGVRPYKRKVHISPQYSPKPLVSHQPSTKEEKVRRQPQTWLGLPIRPRPLDYDEPTGYYLNPNTERVERIDQNGVLHSCPMWVWEEKQRPRPILPFVAEFI